MHHVISYFTFAACSSKKKVRKNKLKTFASAKLPTLFYAPLYVGIEKVFKDEGLNVDLQTTAGGDKTMTALLSGGIDIALVGSETSIYVHQQGAKDPIINFAQLTQTDGTFLVSRKN